MQVLRTSVENNNGGQTTGQAYGAAPNDLDSTTGATGHQSTFLEEEQRSIGEGQYYKPSFEKTSQPRKQISTSVHQSRDITTTETAIPDLQPSGISSTVPAKKLISKNFGSS
jgi:hypothetical protein